ncbi:hypothetical protein PR048_015751 [Dryococelus australis]|uniref:YqaJ viral recombinase domain-containing protein n=1 Tax=Dryococelus australis TaxID=614101 RepID=A0ABQ9HIC2_9NEOP|nr:hypothetical protein PR048_015751 [Dryococelus australis]
MLLPSLCGCIVGVRKKLLLLLHKPTLSRVGTTKNFAKIKDLYKKKSANNHLQNISHSFLSEVVAEGCNLNCNSQISKLYSSSTDNVLSLHEFMYRFKLSGGGNVSEFLEFCAASVSSELCTNAYNSTKEQSKCPIWHELIWPNNWIKRCAVKLSDTNVMQRGRFCTNPILAATHDGICNAFAVEVKCSMSQKCLKNYVLKDGWIAPKYFGQIQLEMLLLQESKGFFCIASPDFEQSNNVTFIWVDYDSHFIQEVIDLAMHFWNNDIFP